jgi:outer membrane protein assembly factor BamB
MTIDLFFSGGFMKTKTGVLSIAVLLTSFIPAVASSSGNDWPRYSFDYSNSNANPHERQIKRKSAPFLRRAWETFNDAQWRPGVPPTGFILEAALGLTFPATVVGVISPPLVIGDTIYYVDAIGTVFSRDAKTGGITDPARHWSTTLVDNDFDATPNPFAPELYYSAPTATATHIWFHSSLNGRVHAVRRDNGQEVDFDTSTAGIQPFPLVADQTLASSLGEAVIVSLDAKGNVIKPRDHHTKPARILYISEVNVILNDALLQGQQSGIIEALDITDPENPVEFWRTSTVNTNPATGSLFNGGNSAGSGLAVDVRRGWLFGGTGQNTSKPYPGYPDPALAPADFTDRSDSIYALDIRTGDFIWTNQFHVGDVFDLNNPVSTGPNMPGGPRDADVLSPPVLYSRRVNGKRIDFVAGGSKGGLFRAINRATGATVWERKISKATGIGGIQAGAAYAKGVIYVAGFEGIDDGFSDANFNIPSSKFPNAFFATFSPSFWADVEDTSDDGRADTGMRIKVYALDAATGRSLWQLSGGRDFVELNEGAALRHVSTARNLVYVTTSSGKLIVLDKRNGHTLFQDQTVDLNQHFGLGLGKPHHASMNAGTIIANGMLYVPYGAQNNPSGGIIAYEINHRPTARRDYMSVKRHVPTDLLVLKNDFDRDGDRLQFINVAGHPINTNDGQPDVVVLAGGILKVFNVGDDPDNPDRAFIRVTASAKAYRRLRFRYTVEDVAPLKVRNNATTDEPETTHTARRSTARVTLKVRKY